MSQKRHTASSITDDALDQLYERLRKAERAADLLAGSHRRVEQADAVTAETKRLMERRTTTLRERAERAEAALERLTKWCDELDAYARVVLQNDSAEHQIAANIRAAVADPKEN
jgi:prefoldin subunit 5